MNISLHTDRHYEAELKQLHTSVLEMGGFVEKQIANAITALVERDDTLARETIQRDHTANRMDVDIDEMCLRLLALHQPAARDLRLITTVLKITTDLERIGDMAVNICERVEELNREPQLAPYVDIPTMADIAQKMVRDSLNAFVQEDVDLALEICRTDEVIDEYIEKLFPESLSYMTQDPETAQRCIRVLFVAKYIERIADHATNIAEMIVFMVKGKSIRHLDTVPPSI